MSLSYTRSTAPNTGSSGPGCALGYAPGLQAIMSESKRVSQVRPAAEPNRWAASLADRKRETMSELTIDLQLTTDTCQHCGRVYQVSRGSVYENGSPFALYIAGMHGCEGDPVVALAIAIASPEGETPSAVTLQVRPSDTQIEMQIVAPDSSPWQSHSYLGHMLTRDEVLSSSLREMFF
jgi:hypothetical protein